MVTLCRDSIVKIVLTTLMLIGVVNNSQAFEPGSKSAEFALPGKQGIVKLSDAAGLVAYVDFWASWCPPCRESFPWMEEMQHKYRSRGFRVIAVNVDAKSEDAKKFLEKNPTTLSIAFDPKGDTPRQYGVKGMPTSVLIGRDGKVISTHQGFREADRLELEQQIKDALEVKP